MTTWREKAREVIIQAIVDGKAQGLESQALKKFVSARYPFGPRQYHPYKIWLEEMKTQMALRGHSSSGKLEMRKATSWRQLP